MLTDDQLGATSRVIVGYLITYAVGKGWLAPADAGALTSALIAVVVPAAHVAYILYSMTQAKMQTAALKTVAAIPTPSGKPTVIVTAPAVAKATPDLPNVVSSQDMAVTSKVSGQELKLPPS